MKIFIPNETCEGESMVSLLPDDVSRLVDKGVVVEVEWGLGESCFHSDPHYEKAGAAVIRDRQAGLADADMVLRRHRPAIEEIRRMKRGAIHISYLDPFINQDLVETLAECAISALSMEMIPRTTMAQKMDALSSQASLAGYAAVILAAAQCSRVFPMMMTAAGTIQPARVFVVGAGVAGLQAIATAKRLGARVEAFDTRPAVAEQVRSLGARFVEIDLGETGQTLNGYARELNNGQLRRQRDVMAKICAQSDIVITTAQVFGRRAPLIITREMVAQMKPGSLIIDMAVSSGGNVEGSQSGREIVEHGVKIIAFADLSGRVAVDASRMYSANISNLAEHIWNGQSRQFELNPEDDIIRACLITHDRSICHEGLKKHYRMESRSAERSSSA